MDEVTRILSAMEHGEPQAAKQLLPLVYDELRRLAAQKLAQEKSGQTLQATALVHEAYLRLVDTEKVQHWNSRAHFYAAAAEAMILVERARSKQRLKRGGGARRQELDDQLWVADDRVDELLAVHEALDELERHDPQAAALVKLRFFSADRGCRWAEFRPTGTGQRADRANGGCQLGHEMNHSAAPAGYRRRDLRRKIKTSASGCQRVAVVIPER